MPRIWMYAAVAAALLVTACGGDSGPVPIVDGGTGQIRRDGGGTGSGAKLDAALIDAAMPDAAPLFPDAAL